MRTVHDGDYSFLYTVGASAIETRGREFRRELFVRDVPEGKTAAVARLLNLLVWRVEDGHLVTEPQYCHTRPTISFIIRCILIAKSL